MTLQRLTIRAKKSISGLYSSDKENVQGSSVPRPAETTGKLPVTPPKSLYSTLDEFGLLRGGDDASPGRDSPSRRQRLLGSLRSMKSMRTLRSAHTSSKKNGEEPANMKSPHTPVRDMPSLSLNFEVSPPDKPMFDPMTRTTSGSSSMKVNHSSPITVPSSSRHTTPLFQSTPPGLTTFVVGTIPDSPAPLQQAAVQEAIINAATKGSPCPGSSTVNLFDDPLPTPMPGTNLPLEDIAAPGIMVTSPSAPSIKQDDLPGYFDSAMSLDGSEYERTSSLVTESGFPTADDPDAAATGARMVELDNPAAFVRETVSEKLVSTTSNESPLAALSDDHFVLNAPNIGPGSNDYGDEVAYIVWDEPRAAIAPEKARKQRPSNWSRLSELYDGTGYGSTEVATGSFHQWSDNINSVTTATTELTDPEEEASEAKLLVAIKELPPALLHGKPQSPADDKKHLQDIIRAYACPIYGERMEDEDISIMGGISLPEEAITQEMREEVETSIRVMNRSLGG
ncbi:hypothetical protein N0V90_000671 [Kalmusia sp. IMI 367209]|nr:hypothetical protein N0V90_000671 [Kalmusia sp. IMI 367209]